MFAHNIALFLSFTLAFASPLARVPDVDIKVQRVPRSEYEKLSRSELVKRAFDVNSYTALGDSFSAGPSAGTQRAVDSDDYDCSRYDGAFPQQLNQDTTLSGPSDRPFAFKACTGAVLNDVITKQIPNMDSGVSMVTMTIGGNDVGFGSIVNNCIYGFKRSAWIWNCEDTMQWARDEMAGDTFNSNYDSVLQGIWDKDPDAHIYIPSYPAFFNVDTDYCSSTCFTATAIICPSEFLLTKQRRLDLNNLVEGLNSQIQTAINRNPPREGSSGQIEFINTDRPYDTHRFCEDGVQEPDYNNPNIWFYPFTYYKRDWLSTTNLDDCDSLEATTPYTGDIGHLIECGLSGMINDDPTVQDTLDNNPALASTQWPDELNAAGSIGSAAMFQRIFHPTVAGMTSFKDDILFAYGNPVLTTQDPPPDDNPPDDNPPDDNPPAEPQILCDLGNYPDPTVGPIGDGISYLTGKRGEQFCVDAKSCGRPSCSYGTGMSVCNDSDQQVCVDLGTVGDQVNEAKDKCGISTDCDDFFCGYYYGQCCSDTVKAFQYFADGYNILVDGGFDC